MALTQQVRDALARDKVIDITTSGRVSGGAHRNEIWFHNIDGTIYITGIPGKRDWYANLAAQPEFTFHLKESLAAELPARATPITEPGSRRQIFERILQNLGRADEIEAWVSGSPLVSVSFVGA